MRFTIPLRKLSKLDVKYVSLVDRGANRIPFRIIKQEQDMSIDLARLGFRTKKADAQTPAKDEAQAKPEATLTAVVLAKNDESLIANARTALAEQGIDLPDTKVFEDGTVALCKGEYEDGAIVRVDENVAVVLKAFEPWGASATDSSFAELVASRGFYDNVRTAMSIASDSLYTSMYDAKSPAEAGTAVKKLMDDLSAYVVSLAKSLPVTVFKAEKVIGEVVAKSASGAPKKLTPEEEAAAAGEGDQPADGAKPAEGDAASADAAAEPAGEQPADDNGTSTDDNADDKKKKPVSMEDVASAMESALTPVMEVLSSMAEKMKAVTDSVAAVSQKIDDVEKSTEQKIDVLAQKADTASQAVRGAVVASETLGDATPAPTKVKKQDADPRSGIFDTAFIRR